MAVASPRTFSPQIFQELLKGKLVMLAEDDEHLEDFKDYTL